MGRPLDAAAESTALGRYELIAELASGGMATVYLGRRSGAFGFQRLVAIKRLHPHLAKDAEFVDMFIDEARVAARIHHPNVVPIVDIETSANGYFLVMEYIEGDTLGRLLARSAHGGARLPMPVCTRIILDALAGLHAAHELKDDDGVSLEIVHRDVSPQNVLVGVDGVARLTDFGVAHAASRLTTTRTGQLKGKLAYMAPEQATSRRKRPLDRRADVFAMGILLWEAASAKRLFKGEHDAETLNRVLNEPIPKLSTVLPGAPEAVEAVCARALARDPDERFASAAEMADELERAGRAGGWLGGARDVAVHLEAVLGSDIAQNREALRQWTARSEPRGARTVPPSTPSTPSSPSSGTPSRARPPPPAETRAEAAQAEIESARVGAQLRTSEKTRVDGHRSNTPPPVIPLASSPYAPEDSRPEASGAGGAAPARADRGPASVSSVSSAAIAVPQPAGSAGSVTPLAGTRDEVGGRRSPSSAMRLLATLALVAAAAVAFGRHDAVRALRGAGDASGAGAEGRGASAGGTLGADASGVAGGDRPVPADPVAPSALGRGSGDAPAARGADDADGGSPPAVASATRRRSIRRAPPRPEPHVEAPEAPSAAPPPVTTPSTTPDEIEHNPYR